MKVGDLVRYKEFPQNGYGVVLEVDGDMLLLFWAGESREHDDYTWEQDTHLEVISPAA